ncbi:glycosyltransferase family 4 protein [Trinickia dinghuensis]|uniref:Glycosyltransferase family 1 protein n=1 Tax=Trinickia dinghuensis TaxID=2291023 RepID=A0A3D8JSM8_9BURK|nr:glycosyltransferase family 1 protein [Trinickia dinghuensis]RDU96038.1 glycosyltransferase family 1 protein [Trinickia dinghuensis]
MNILINAHSARLGGGQTYLINLLKHLPDENEFKLFVYAPASLELPADPRIERLTTAWPTTNPLTRFVWERFVLPGVLRKLDIDVLFCPGGVIGTTPPTGCRTVTMFRNMIPFDMRVRRAVPYGLQRVRNWLLERVMLRSMAGADLVIFISDFARGVIESRITVRQHATIPHGVPDLFKAGTGAQPRPLFVPQDEYLLYVSRFDVYKHHYEVVSGYARLPQPLRERYKLVLVGEADSPEAGRVQALIDTLQLNDRVVVAGAAKYQELPAAYRHAALILFASSCENCPNILLEALGAGRPVLSSSVDPMPEFGADAVAYFDPRDPDQISETMQKVLTSPDRGEELGRKAAARSRRYDWKVTAASTWRRILAL